MKKFLSAILLIVLLSTTTACSTNNTASTPNTNSTVATEATTATEQTTDKSDNLSIDDQIKNAIKSHDFEGILYVTKNGEVVHQSATGTDENQKPLTIDTPMLVGSVSKQFCATAILLLRDQGKLKLEDTLSKYFPEYEIGKDITLKDLLSMRSGIPDMVNDGTVEEASQDKSEEENTKAIKEWIFSQDLAFEPNSEMSYSNSNYFLLSNIVEIVSGQRYIDFISENIFQPLGMKNTGSIEEIKDSPEWAKGINIDSVEDAKIKGLTKGSGNLASTAKDMDMWMSGLKSGKIISLETYQEMITNYSPESESAYGYGLMPEIYGGVGHAGGIEPYISFNYIDEEHGYNLFIVSNNITPYKLDELLNKLCVGIIHQH